MIANDLIYQQASAHVEALRAQAERERQLQADRPRPLLVRFWQHRNWKQGPGRRVRPAPRWV